MPVARQQGEQVILQSKNFQESHRSPTNISGSLDTLRTAPAVQYDPPEMAGQSYINMLTAM